MPEQRVCHWCHAPYDGREHRCAASALRLWFSPPPEPAPPRDPTYTSPTKVRVSVPGRRRSAARTLRLTTEGWLAAGYVWLDGRWRKGGRDDRVRVG